ncbi:unnamed protein product [Polarella glacialis]|uniref:Uncharacterized protein n=1 Tax=Polarella glacialis TaxID=89957 RepID=A0A813EFJ3_POLGL|nr:unnamed protein product [Polarella glacialis]
MEMEPSHAQALTGAPQLIFGLPIQNERLAKLTRKVLIVALVSAVLVLIRGFIGLASGGGAQAPEQVLGMALALLVPICGYLGAKKSDQVLTCCFCCCNLLGSCLTIFVFVTAFAASGVLSYIVQNCDPRNNDGTGCPTAHQWLTYCPDLPEGYTAEDCYSDLQGQAGDMQSTLHWMVLLVVPSVLMQCLGFCWGNQLYSELKQGAVLVQPPMYPTTTMAVQHQPPATPYDSLS